MLRYRLMLALLVFSAMTVFTGSVPAAPSPIAMANHTYEAKIRLDGKVSTTQVQASDAGHAKMLVQAQYGPKVIVLSVKRVD
jgi:hypothetical protein